MSHPVASASTAHADPHAPHHGAHVPARARTAVDHARYLINPKTAAVVPSSLATRSTLRSLRYVFKFVFWRLVRYFKYAAIAAGTTALAGTALGVALPWVGALIVPSVPVAAAMGLTTSVIKFTWHHRGNRFRQGWLAGGEGRDAKRDEEADAHEAAREFERPAVHPRAADSWKTEAFA